MLQNKLVLITGASRGIGRTIAIEAAKNGADLVLNYVSPSSYLAIVELKKKIEEMGREAIDVRADISNWKEVEMMKEKVEEYGEIDVLVSNAGITMDALITKMSIEAWLRVIEVNLTGAFL